MDRANTPIPGLISSLEAMINASVSAALDRRLGHNHHPLSVQVDTAVASALDRCLGLGDGDLDNHIETSVARAVNRRLGPLDSAISAQIILGAPQSPVSESTQPNHNTVPQTAARALLSAVPRKEINLQDLRYDIGLAKAQLEGLDDNDGEYAVNKMVADHDLAALPEQYTGAEGGKNVQQQQGPNRFGTPAVEEAESGQQVKDDLQKVEAKAMGYMMLARSSLPPENQIPPHESTLDTDLQSLEASATKRESSAKRVSAATRIRLDQALETERAENARNITPQGRRLSYYETSTENLLNNSDEVDESLFVETEDLGHSTNISLRERTPGSIKMLEEIITPGSADASQLSAARMADGGVREVIPFTQREIEAPTNVRPLSVKSSPPPESLPQLDFAVVVHSSSEGNSVQMKQQNKNLSGELEKTSSHEVPRLPQVSGATTLKQCSPPTDVDQNFSAEVEELLFVEQGRVPEAPKRIEKRKASTPENAAEALAESGEKEAPPKRKRAKVNPPGYTEGPAIRFLKVCSQLTARTKGGRGYPRVVNLESFTEHSNKQNFTMADIVATILWNHKPESLQAFLDTATMPSFSFVRKEGDKKRRNLAIERQEEESGTMVTVSGFDCFPRMLGLTHPGRSATIVEAPVISGMSTTSIPSKHVEGGIQSDTKLVPFLPLSARKRSRKQQ